MTNQRDAVDILLRRSPGCMVLRDTLGRTFLHVAVENKASNIVKYACARSKFASIMNIQDKNGNTPLYLAVEAQSVMMTCALLGNLDVRLNLWNGKGQTALDLARGRIRTGSAAKLIYSTLESVGARHGIYCIPKPKPNANGANKEEVSDELDKVTSLSPILIVVSMVIMLVSFVTPFATHRVYSANDHTDAGTPALAERWCFDAFMVANTLAFICSSLATVGFMQSSAAMVTLPIRQEQLVMPMFFCSSSSTSLIAVLALGMFMVLSPSAIWTSIAICTISPLLMLFKNAKGLRNHAVCSFPLFARRGFLGWLMWTVPCTLLREIWPFLVIFGWAAIQDV